MTWGPGTPHLLWTADWQSDPASENHEIVIGQDHVFTHSRHSGASSLDIGRKFKRGRAWHVCVLWYGSQLFLGWTDHNGRTGGLVGPETVQLSRKSRWDGGGIFGRRTRVTLSRPNRIRRMHMQRRRDTGSNLWAKTVSTTSRLLSSWKERSRRQAMPTAWQTFPLLAFTSARPSRVVCDLGGLCPTILLVNQGSAQMGASFSTTARTFERSVRLPTGLRLLQLVPSACSAAKGRSVGFPRLQWLKSISHWYLSLLPIGMIPISNDIGVACLHGQKGALSIIKPRCWIPLSRKLPWAGDMLIHTGAEPPEIYRLPLEKFNLLHEPLQRYKIKCIHTLKLNK